MRLSRRQLSLLIENYLLTEHNKREFTDLVNDGSLTQNDYNQVYKPNGQPKGIFKDNTLRKVLYNTLLQKQGHSVDDFIENFRVFKQKIIDPFNKKQLRVLRVPGTSNEQLDLATLLSQQKATYDDFQQYVEIISSTDARSDALQQIIDEGFAGNTQHFEVIHEDNNWIVCYPKTYQGSISIARMGPDKQYYTPPRGIGNLNWCTSIDSGGNMFLNYHRAMNLHMYYITKKRGFDPRARDKKICASFVKNSEGVHLNAGNSTVDGNNKSISKEVLIEFIGESLFNILKQDAMRPERKNISIQKYYASVSYEQYVTLRQAANNMDSNDYSLFVRETSYFAIYSKNKQIHQSILNDPDPKIGAYAYQIDDPEITTQIFDRDIDSHDPDVKNKLARLDNLSQEQIKRLFESDDQKVLGSLANRYDLPREIIRSLASNRDSSIRQRIARNISVNDYNILFNLCKDSSEKVRRTVAYRTNLPIDIMVEMYYDDDKNISDAIKYEFESYVELSPASDSSLEDKVSELGQWCEFNVDESGELGTEIWKLVDDLYSERNTFHLEKEFERYIKDHNDKNPRLTNTELDSQDALKIAKDAQKHLKLLNDQRREYYKFVLSGRAEEAGLPREFLKLDRAALYYAGLKNLPEY